MSGTRVFARNTRRAAAGQAFAPGPRRSGGHRGLRHCDRGCGRVFANDSRQRGKNEPRTRFAQGTCHLRSAAHDEITAGRVMCATGGLRADDFDTQAPPPIGQVRSAQMDADRRHRNPSGQHEHLDSSYGSVSSRQSRIRVARRWHARSDPARNGLSDVRWQHAGESPTSFVVAARSAVDRSPGTWKKSAMWVRRRADSSSGLLERLAYLVRRETIAPSPQRPRRGADFVHETERQVQRRDPVSHRPSAMPCFWATAGA
jgi:hypothetical protein